MAWIELTVWLPEVAFEPDQPPEAVQLVAFEVDHESAELAPGATVVGFADRLTVGAGVPPPPPLMVIDAVRVTLPPGPEHCNVNVWLLVRLPSTHAEVASGFEPDQPGAPEALQLVAFVDVQASETLPPLTTVVGVAENVSVGAPPPGLCTVMLAVRVTLPPVPVHCRVNVWLLVRLPRSHDDIAVGREPDQPGAPEALQLVAFVDDHESDTLPP